ncbi:MAG: YvcK family protein [bacterium]|nr:YvcK family protein [bacterium]
MKFFKKLVPKGAAIFLPGLNLKRWFSVQIIGILFALVGLCVIFDFKPIYHLISCAMRILDANWTLGRLVGAVLIILGAYAFLKGWKISNDTVLKATDDNTRANFLNNLVAKRKLNNGPKIVAIGGGTGLSTMLKGIKKITNNITAVVTVGDDGGSSGRLREEMGVLPPGDIRNCIAALADDDDLVTKLFQYRFKKNVSELGGHSFGNLFITAMCEITGDMYKAVIESSKVLAIRGRVLPSTLDDMKLVAEMEDGTIIKGESVIPESGKKIKRLFTDPEHCLPLDDVLTAIREAELIIMGPGSLYTSVLPNLLIKEIAEEIEKSNAKKLYICNVMTQPGETDGFTVSDHVKTILNHVENRKIIDTVLVNNYFPEEALEKYKAEHSYPVLADYDELKKLGVNVFEYRLTDNDSSGYVRHNPSRLMRAVYYWYRKADKLKEQQESEKK